MGKRKRNIGLYFVGMLVLFLLVFIFQETALSWLFKNFQYLKYGHDVIAEAIWAGLVLIVLLLFKNSYIFTQEKEPFWKSLKTGWPELVMSCIFLLFGILGLIGQKISAATIINLGIYCLFIGIVEEFLCRGWLLNEFLERFSDTKKGTIQSIILSSLVFGAIHLINVLSGQGLAETVVQVVNATVGGIFLALVYYKTKNIWASVTLHAVWDFSIMLSESHTLVDCVAGTATKSIVIYNIIQSIGITIAYLILNYWLFKQTDLVQEERRISKGWKVILPIIGIVIYLFSVLAINSPDIEDYYICPTYNNQYLGEEKEFHIYNYSEYTVTSSISPTVSKITTLDISLNGKTSKLEIQNRETHEMIELTDKMVYDYVVLDNENTYSILIQTDYNKVLYGSFEKNQINDTKEYLESIKDSLVEYITPEMDGIGSIKVKEEEFEYAMVRSTTYDILYFDEEDNFLIDKED